MKGIKFFLILILAFYYSPSYGQVIVDGTDINRLPEVKYCQVSISGKMFAKNIEAHVDYGQEKLNKKNSRIQSTEGNHRKFKTAIDLINFMAYNKWEFVESYISIDNNDPYKHYLFKKN